MIEWLERNMLPCWFKKYFGLDCPGCGMQRSFAALLKGEFVESFILFPALIPTIGLVVFLLIHLKMKFENGGTILKWLFIGNSAIIVISYILKQVQIFTY